MEQNYNTYDEEISLLEIINILRRNLIVIIAGTLLFALLAFFISIMMNLISGQTPLYRAVTKVEVIAAEDMTKQQQAVIDLMKSETVIDQAMTNIKMNGEASDIRNLVDAKMSEKPNVIEISVVNQEGTKARELADEIRVQGLNMVNNSMNLAGTNLVETAVVSSQPIYEDKPVKVSLNTAIGGVLGLMLVVFIIFIKYFLNNTIRTPEDVERYLGQRVLVSIPSHEDKKGWRELLTVR